MQLKSPEQIQEMKDYIAEINPDALFADGFDEAIIGFVERERVTVVLYDIHLICEVIMKHDGWTHEEALEHFYHNIEPAYVGEHTPAYATLFST